MGFLDNIVSAAVKIALTPLAVAKDAVSVIADGEVNNSKKLVKSAIDDASKALDSIT